MGGSTSIRARQRLAWFLAALSVVAYVVVMAPLQRAWFADDDWHFLALLRHVDSPADAFVQHFMGSYGYRPVAIQLFSVTVSWFGVDPLPHYALNALLHGAVALLLGRAALMLAAPGGLALAVAVVFLLAPVSQATPLWISNRFDLLAAVFCLVALLYALRWLAGNAGRRRDAAGCTLALLLALGCKETALAMVPALLVLLLTYPATTHGRGGRIGFALLLSAAAAMYWLARVHALGEAAGAGRELPWAAGIWRWCQGAIWLVGQPLVFTGGTLLLAALLMARYIKIPSDSSACDAVRVDLSVRRAIRFTLLVLVLGVVVLQAPIAATALDAATSSAGSEGAQMPLVSRRFFYLTAAVGLLWPATMDWSQLHTRRRFGGLVPALVLAGLAALAASAERQSQRWAEATGGARLTYQAVQSEVNAALDAAFARARQAPTANACVIDFTSAGRADHRPLPTGGLAIDLIAKAHLTKHDPRVVCVLVTEPPQAMAISRVQPCSQAALPGWQPLHPTMTPLVRSGTCTFFAQVAAPL